MLKSVGMNSLKSRPIKPVQSYALMEVLIHMAPNTSSAQQLYFHLLVLFFFASCTQSIAVPTAPALRDATEGMSEWDKVPA